MKKPDTQSQSWEEICRNIQENMTLEIERRIREAIETGKPFNLDDLRALSGER